MQNYKIILFKRSSSYFLYDKRYYLKESLFTYIKELKKENGVFLQNQFLDNKGNIIFSLTIYEKNKEEKLYVKMHCSEKSVKEFQKLFYERKKRKRKVLSIAIATMVFLLKPIPLEEDTPIIKETVEYEKK